MSISNEQIQNLIDVTIPRIFRFSPPFSAKFIQFQFQELLSSSQSQNQDDDEESILFQNSLNTWLLK